MKIKTISAIALVALAFASCKKEEVNIVEENPSATVEVEVFPEEVENSYSIEFIDAKTGNPIGVDGDKVVNVEITGKDKGSVTSYEGVPGTTHYSENGLLAFSSSKVGTESNPFDINVVAHLDGYVSTSKRLQAFEKGETAIQIAMVKLTDTPNGVTAVQNNAINTTTGVTASEVVIEAAVTSGLTSTKTTTKVTVPAGIEMKDENGNVLKGAVSSTLVYFNNEDDEALDAFPGGFDAVVDRNGAEEDGNFVTAGFVSLEMMVGGTKVSSFSKPITITTEVPAATINPSTGNKIQTGETIDIWSYDTETGSWTYENTATFGVQLSNGNFEAVMTPNHLSYWNLDWHYRGKCARGAVITITGADLTNGEYVSFDLLYKNSGRRFRSLRKRVKNGEVVQFRNAPPKDFIIKPGKSRCAPVAKYSGQLEFNGCGSGGTLNLTKTAASTSSSTVINVTADVSGYCSSQRTTLVKPSATIYVRKVGACGGWKRYRMNRGKVSFNGVIVGGTYRTAFRYNGQWHFRTAVVSSSKTHYVLSGEISPVLCN